MKISFFSVYVTFKSSLNHFFNTFWCEFFKFFYLTLVIYCCLLIKTLDLFHWYYLKISLIERLCYTVHLVFYHSFIKLYIFIFKVPKCYRQCIETFSFLLLKNMWMLNRQSLIKNLLLCLQKCDALSPSYCIVCLIYCCWSFFVLGF